MIDGGAATRKLGCLTLALRILATGVAGRVGDTGKLFVLPKIVGMLRRIAASPSKTREVRKWPGV